MGFAVWRAPPPPSYHIEEAWQYAKVPWRGLLAFTKLSQLVAGFTLLASAASVASLIGYVFSHLRRVY